MKNLLSVVSLVFCSFIAFSQDKGSGPPKQDVTSKKEAERQKRQLDRIHEKDKDAMDKQSAQFNKKKYKKDINFKGQ